ncbi:hypothetical protein [Alicyclobacillus sp. SO9]|uniref:hypothetical protein n=1 Tax=Alicyclobacillus sp. SO9 TaxID=2665646 RepID=UPI0018E7416F|nr:hypothetical protein [Alicyclobacillus sp. SO9]QQE77233.1 hypothetical protein GI364_14830 [Alicyclobacillus sp. SO9]
MRNEFSWQPSMEVRTREIESLTRDKTMNWIDKSRSEGLSNADIYLLLALASARYVDHHGPLIGHGTFNGGPLLRASSLLSSDFQDLALLQTAVYVTDLLADPRYGPYLLMEMEPVTETTEEESQQAFLHDIESGNTVLLSEHRLVGLLRHQNSDLRWLLTQVALRQYPENEHRLLIVHRAIQFLDDLSGWAYAEPIFRPAVQYLASRPDTTLFNRIKERMLTWPEEGMVSEHEVTDVVQRLIEVPYGEEPDLIDELIRQGIKGRTLYEAIALSSSEMLRRSQFDAHAVTGVHCTLDLMRGKDVPSDLRTLAGHLALSSQRSRRQKVSRQNWREPLHVSGTRVTLTELKNIVSNDDGGQLSAQAAGNYLLSGGSPRELARTLMEVALTTSGPFDAIHNVKMIWGLLQETEYSQLGQQSWRHLSGGARVIAETAATERPAGKAILSLWKPMKSM